MQQAPDPYRWLEDPDSAETRAWIDAENALTRSYLAAVPSHAATHARLTALWNYERFGPPTKEAGRYFFERNDGLQQQSVLYVADALDAPPRVLLDANTLSADGSVSVAGTSVSEGGRFLAYSISDGGSDWRTVKVRDIDSGADLADEVRWVKFSDTCWTHDDKGFYYSRYPEPTSPLEQVNENHKLYYHLLGTAQDQDRLVHAEPDFPRRGVSCGVSDDGKTLVIYGSEGTEQKNRLYLLDLQKKGATLNRLLDAFDAEYSPLGNQGDRWFFKTNLDAPRGRIIAIDLKRPAAKDWVEIVPQAEETLDGASLVGGKLVLQYLKDARSAVRVVGLDGKGSIDVALPGVGSVGGFGGESADSETFYSYTDFTTPTALYRYDVATGASTLWKQPTVAFDGAGLVTDQVFYPSKDGTMIPMFLVHRRDVVLDGENPTLLYGYGGFNIPLTPGFSVTRAVWLEMGGVLAIANLRGGGEYGEEWHAAGTRERKQNVFDDFIAGAEWLIANHWTRSERLAVQGGSNGGLLVGAVITQRPELFGAALPAVGVMDMLRYHQFTIGWAWASDYGRSDEPEMFPILRAYSPVHNAVAGTDYPTTMVTTADHDDRVVPAHSFKFAAALQHAHSGADPVLIRVETRAGHGAGKSTAARIDEAADTLSFLVRALFIDVPVAPPQQ